jgi:ketosteroid isomerase-like protein
MAAVEEVDDATREAILAVEAGRRRALVAGDLAALDAIFDDALIHIHAPGLVHTKAMLLEHVATRRAYLSIDRGDLTIRRIGDVAIMVGPIVNQLRNPDGSTRRQTGTVTQVLRRSDDGAWRFVNFQLTPTGDEIWGKLPSELASEHEKDTQ